MMENKESKKSKKDAGKNGNKVVKMDPKIWKERK
jgi:hypothetical protein